MSELIPIREAARRLGVSDTAVRKAIDTGRVKVAGKNPNNNRPLLAWPECRDQWLANSDSSKRSHVGGTGTSPERKKYAKTPPEVDLPTSNRMDESPTFNDGGDGPKSGRGGDYAKARAAREVYQAKLAKLEFDERSGKLVQADVVRVEAFKTHRRVRDAMLNIPDRCSPHLAAMTDPAEVHAYLLGEVNAALRQLSADIYAATE